MKQPFSQVASTQQTSTIATHQVLRNTYMLLSLTVLFSALTAWFAMATNAPNLGLFGIVGMFGLLFLTQATRNSVWGLASCFAFTGFMGYILGPMLSAYLQLFSNGGELIFTALGATGVTFLALSAYVLKTRQDFSYMGGFLVAGLIIAIVASIANIFLQMPMLDLAVSCAIALISAGLILFHTSNIVNGGETNYIMATVALYVTLFNLFVSLLRILSAFGGNRN